MANQLTERAARLNEIIEFNLRGWPLVTATGFLSWAVYCIVYPSNWFILFRWSWFSMFWAVAILAVLLRHVPWSPYYVGPTITLTDTEIIGQGGWGHEKWRFTWDEVERVDWGRFGIVIYKKGQKNWEPPVLQVGPFNVSLPALVRCINARLDTYRACQKELPESANG